MSDTDDVGATDARERAERRGRWWWPRAYLGPEDRRRVMAALFPPRGDAGHWWFRYGVMMGLSVVIATMGLSLNSTAVVIGAMLVAPLMTPVLGTSASLVMAWPRQLGRSMLAVVLGAVGSIALAYVIVSLLPAADRTLTAELLARTSPDLRDLIVALAAGAAGAYATARPGISDALPGVAVAVALVPPLAAAGFALAIGRGDLAEGALLLFTVNLVAIILVGGIVFVGSGFVPSARYEASPHTIRVGLAIVALVTAALAVPLTIASLKSASHFQLAQSVNRSVVTWLEPYPQLQVTSVTFTATRVYVEVTGPVEPPATQGLERTLVAVFGHAVSTTVHWTPSA